MTAPIERWTLGFAQGWPVQVEVTSHEAMPPKLEIGS